MKKLITCLVFLMACTLCTAQRFINPLGSVTTPIYSDTVTNTGTAYISVQAPNNVEYVTIQVNVTKISGTVGGTISIQGSVDGSNYSALNTEETQTAVATKTAADASAVYHWRLVRNPFNYYRISWTGTGTMAASFSGFLLAR